MMKIIKIEISDALDKYLKWYMKHYNLDNVELAMETIIVSHNMMLVDLTSFQKGINESMNINLLLKAVNKERGITDE